MSTRFPRRPLAAALILALASGTALADRTEPTQEELLQRIESLERMLQELKEQTRQAAGSAAQARTEAAAAAKTQAQEAAAVAEQPAAQGWWNRTSVNGYGELHYNNLEADDYKRDKKEFDLHRFVLGIEHRFSEKARLHGEVEFEHNTTKDNNDGSGKSSPGEVEIEQAWIEYRLREDLAAQGGVFLLPVGILNQTHEPGTFYGVERNDVESVIVPTTWWTGGAGLFGDLAPGVGFNVAVHEGQKMSTTGGNAFRVRQGRQKTSEASGEDPAVTAALKFTRIPGLELGGAVQYQSDASQIDDDGLDEGFLYEGHAVYNRGMFGLRALYALWDFDGSAISATGDDQQFGWYLEPSIKPRSDLGFYARYEEVEGGASTDEFQQWETGLNYWPQEDVVLKADWRDRSYDKTADSGRDFDGFDLGIGWQFH